MVDDLETTDDEEIDEPLVDAQDDTFADDENAGLADGPGDTDTAEGGGNEGEVNDEATDEQAAVEQEKPGAADEETPDAPDAETEFNGFLIASHGLDLYEPACEDENSAEAKEYIEANGERAYDKLVRDYDRSKTSFYAQVDENLIQAATIGQQSVVAQVETEKAALAKDWFPERTDADRDDLHKAAALQIRQAFDGRVKTLTDAGVPKQRAILRANADLTAIPDLYADAWKVALLTNPALFARLVKGSAAATVPVKADTSRPPVPPGIGGGRGNAAGERAQNSGVIVPTAEEKRAAAQMGIDPVKLAKRVRG